jgi:protein-tyrosine phosphatase
MAAKIVQITDGLFISDYITRESFKELERLGISAIVNLSLKEDYYPPPPHINYLHAGFPDGTYPSHHKLREIYNFIQKEKKKGKILVHCLAGVSRSAGILIGQLMIENQWSWNKAFNILRDKKWVMPAHRIKESVIDFINSKRKSNK